MPPDALAYYTWLFAAALAIALAGRACRARRWGGQRGKAAGGILQPAGILAGGAYRGLSAVGGCPERPAEENHEKVPVIHPAGRWEGRKGLCEKKITKLLKKY